MTKLPELNCQCLVVILAMAAPSVLCADEVYGLIIPRDDKGMYVRNDQGQFEVTWTRETKVTLVTNTLLFSGLKPNRLEYRIHSSKEVVTFPIPDGPITGVRTVRGGKQFEQALEEARSLADSERAGLLHVHAEALSTLSRGRLTECLFGHRLLA